MALVDLVKVGYSNVAGTRKPISDYIEGTLQGMADASPLNIWEFTHLITSKPNADDPSTWDWTPAIQGAIDQVANGVGILNPGVSGGCILIPAAYKNIVYRVTELDVPLSVCILAPGATLTPVNFQDSRTHLLKLSGMNKITGLQIAMNYSLTYDSAIWCRGRNIDCVSCAVWFSKNAVLVGDPAWASTPADAWLGDSEISFSNCQFNWCLRTCTAYGLNTIVMFGGGSRCYANRGSIPPGHPNAAAWANTTMWNMRSFGALLYIVGAFLGTFERDAPALQAECIQVARADYNNSFGRFFVDGTHIETSFLYYAPSPSGFSAQDTITKTLVVRNYHGHVATSPTNGWWVNASSQLTQGIDIDGSNSFYGTHGVAPTRVRCVTAPNTPVHIDASAFTCIAGEFKDACNINYPVRQERLLLVSAFGSAQSISTSSSTLVMPSNGTTDLIGSSRSFYYDNGTGLYTAAVELADVSIDLSLSYAAPNSLNQVTVDLVVSGAVVDTVVLTGGYPRARLYSRRISKGSTFLLRATGSGTYALDGTASTKTALRARV